MPSEQNCAHQDLALDALRLLGQGLAMDSLVESADDGRINNSQLLRPIH